MDEAYDDAVSRRTLRLHPHLLGCAFLIFSFFVTVQDVNPLMRSAIVTQNLHEILPYILSGIALSGFFISLNARWRHSTSKNRAEATLGPTPVVITTAFLALSLILIHQLMPVATPLAPVSELTGLVAGFTAAWLSARWIDVLSHYDEFSIMGNLALCGCLGIPAYVLTTLVPAHTVQTAIIGIATLT